MRKVTNSTRRLILLVLSGCSQKFLVGVFWKICGAHAKSNGSQRAVSLYGVCIAHIHKGVLSVPFIGVLQNMR